MATTTDLFEDILNLEDQFYQQGYEQGIADGVQAGMLEGRQLGLEKGFEKFLESGRLYGKSLVWGNRLPHHKKPSGSQEFNKTLLGQGAQATQKLPPLSGNPRLEKNIIILHALVEPESLSTDNTDEAVNDFDDRIKRAQGKAKIIEKMTGEHTPVGPGAAFKASPVDLATEVSGRS